MYNDTAIADDNIIAQMARELQPVRVTLFPDKAQADAPSLSDIMKHALQTAFTVLSRGESLSLPASVHSALVYLSDRVRQYINAEDCTGECRLRSIGGIVSAAVSAILIALTDCAPTDNIMRDELCRWLTILNALKA